MAIDTNVTVEAQFARRWLTAKRLKEILEQLDDDVTLHVNPVGNLTVRNDARQVLGYIDFANEQLELAEDIY